VNSEREERPELHEYLESNRRLTAKLIAVGRHPKRIYHDFRHKRRDVRRDDEIVIELIRALSEFVVLGNAGFEPRRTPELCERAGAAVCDLVINAQQLPAHLWRMTRNQSTICAICSGDCDYRAHLCPACKATSKAA
jgi:hypothetical protein